jgi:hypothetical protein
LFLYREVLQKHVETGIQYLGAKKPRRMPIVHKKSEFQQILVRLCGDTRLGAQVQYENGLRLNEEVLFGANDIDLSNARSSSGMAEAFKIEYRC